MNEQEQAIFLKDAKALIEGHAAIPTPILRHVLVETVMLHQAAQANGSPPMLEMLACVLISLINEVMEYRNRYGLVALPDDDWKMVPAGE